MMNALPHWVLCGCLLLSIVQARTGLGMQYHVRDMPLPDMTIPQDSAQVVSPTIYMKLGEQDKAIQFAETRFAAIDQRFRDEDNSLEKLRNNMKPLEEASVQAHLMIKGIGIIFGFLLSIGFFNYFKEYFPVKRRVANGGSLSSQPGIMSSVYAAPDTSASDPQSGSNIIKDK